jgi:pyrimidine-nucleoside phosphorylase
MRAVDIIEKKKHGMVLTSKEIEYMVNGYTQGNIPDYQMSAFLMAIYFKGMDKEETSNLTLAFVNSGYKVNLSMIEGVKVDKHSTGGVGDKISLIVIPLVASVGVPVAKMSGRGLGHTGGTIDKLESIKGFKVEMTIDQFVRNVNKYKMAIVGQSANLTPADKKIYSLRDVTSTVDSIPLIASSIMSKKIASGSDAIVLDVKVGSGAFMKSIDEAKNLAKNMVDIGKSLDKDTIAVITNMNQPLGYEVGNANEIKEAIKVLKGEGAEDETTVALTIASYMCILGGAFDDFDKAYSTLSEIIKSGKAIEKLKELIRIQGGDPTVVDNPEKLPNAKEHIEVKSIKTGYVGDIDAENIGIAAMLLGAGRRTKEDKIDYAAGISLKKKLGDFVEEGEIIGVLHTNLEEYENAYIMLLNALTITDKKPKAEKYIYDIIK